MKNITIKRLKEAGWNESRKINIDIIKKRYKEIGLEMPLNIQCFLEQYGMVKSDPKDKIYFDVEFNPLKAIGINLDGDYFRELLEEYGIEETCYPIGIACRDNLEVVMTEKNVFFCFTDGCLVKVGENIEEMLDCIVGECRKPETIE